MHRDFIGKLAGSSVKFSPLQRDFIGKLAVAELGYKFLTFYGISRSTAILKQPATEHYPEPSEYSTLIKLNPHLFLYNLLSYYPTIYVYFFQKVDKTVSQELKPVQKKRALNTRLHRYRTQKAF